MKEINISNTLTTKRKEKGITQDQLASYMGVSKASVSKWETGQSYPDITFLPQLATYFNISIDELIGYTPQMSEEDIRKLYHRMAEEFSTKPFDEVYDECAGIIKKYYACFPLLLQMAVLYLNHHLLADSQRQPQILEEALSLCQRVKTESDDPLISKDAITVEATCYLMMHRPMEVVELYGQTPQPLAPETEGLAQAYFMLGDMEKANRTLQISIYQHLLFLESGLAQMLMLPDLDPLKIEEVHRRMMEIAQVFDLNDLHPSTMFNMALTSAQIFCGLGDHEKALDQLELYVSICRKHTSFTLHGDEFFDAIDDWIADFALGNQAPRSNASIKASLIQAIEGNPALAPLFEMPRFKNILLNLKTICGGDSNE